MSPPDKETKKAQRAAQMAVWMVTKSSRNKTLSDKFCRFLVSRSTAVKPEDDFMRDPIIDNDRGFDPDELERFQRGEAD